MDRVYIMQDGDIIGSIPRPKTPPRISLEVLLGGGTWQFPSTSLHGDPLASVRTTDFKTEEFVINDGWGKETRLVADPMLGLGDLENIRGFMQHYPDRKD